MDAIFNEANMTDEGTTVLHRVYGGCEIRKKLRFSFDYFMTSEEVRMAITNVLGVHLHPFHEIAIQLYTLEKDEPICKRKALTNVGLSHFFTRKAVGIKPWGNDPDDFDIDYRDTSVFSFEVDSSFIDENDIDRVFIHIDKGEEGRLTIPSAYIVRK